MATQSVWEILGNRVAIRRETPKETTSGGIVLASEAQEVENKGTIVGVGDRCDRPWEAGTKVLFESFGGTESKLDSDEPIIIMEESGIIAVLREQACLFQ